ncbi:hypothetical protein [Holdemania massiliensis]|uniref:hypothetical protein n=1 Tax=Holdemania massiliensis TaxID=1468449 RepID=UPI003C6CCA11
MSGVQKLASHRSCGAWIEISLVIAKAFSRQSHRSCGAWIEMDLQLSLYKEGWSHRSCGAWIEIIAYKYVICFK